MAINWSSLIGIALWALIPGFIAQKKGRSFAAYYFLSFVITPLVTTIITLCVSNLNKVSADESSSAEAKSTVAQEDKWICKCGSENVNSLSYCPICKRTREEVEGAKE